MGDIVSDLMTQHRSQTVFAIADGQYAAEYKDLAPSETLSVQKVPSRNSERGWHYPGITKAFSWV